MEKGNRWKWKSNKAGIVILISDKIDFKKKCCKRQLHNDQTINQRIKSYDCKYICTQHRSTSIYKANNNGHKRSNQQ